MKRLLLIPLLVLGIGCASVTYTKVTDEDGKVVEKFKYSRSGKQKIGKFSSSINKNGIMTVKFEGQEADAGQIGSIMNNMSKVMYETAKSLP